MDLEPTVRSDTHAALRARLLALAVAGLSAFVVCGCRAPSVAQPEAPLTRFEFQSAHMGTLFHMTLFATNQPAAEAAAEAAFRRIVDLENTMSDYQADSELNLLCQKPVGVPVPVSPDLFDVLWQARRFSQLTDGAFDVTVGPYVRLWRFARKRKVLPKAEELAAARAAVGWRNLELDRHRRTATLRVSGMRLDLGGIAKGYASDEALKVLRDRGIRRALVAASGDIAVSEPPPTQNGWRVGISGLGSETNAGGSMLLLRNAAISTSGDTEQFIEIEGVRYSHIVDPYTGLGLTNRIQASIVASKATTSDALATAVCILGPKRGLKLVNSQRGIGARIVTQNGAGNRILTNRMFRKLEGR